MCGSGQNELAMRAASVMPGGGSQTAWIRGEAGKKGRNISAHSYHSLRHSFNSALAKANVSQELRQKLTGHASEAMNTLYTHHELEVIRGAVQSLPRLPKE